MSVNPPIIALTMRVTGASNYVEPRDSISHDWIAAVRSWGAIPALIPNGLDNPGGYLDGTGAALLILTGGDDFGSTPERDRTEMALLDQAMKRGLPTLGVCRGMQIINAKFGGITCPIRGHAATTHTVSFSGFFRTIYGDRASTNSFHENAIAGSGLGRGLTPTALDGTDHVEAFHHESAPVAGVMWHPERPGAPAGDCKLIGRLIGKESA